MPGVDAVGRVRRQLDLLHVGQLLAEEPGNRLAARAHLFGSVELMNADGGGNVRQVVLVAGGDDPIIPGMIAGIALPGVVRQPVQRHLPHPVGQSRVVGHGDAALRRW